MEKSGKAQVITAPDNADKLGTLAHTILDDILYNVVHDLLLHVHQNEKTARANTAAIRIEKTAFDNTENPLPDERPEVRVENATAIYNYGEVYLKGNPLKTTPDILCPRCHLPRLLYPTDGNGARKPDPSVIYCKKHPYIDKPGYDIYGQTWVGPGPGRGKKKKDMEKNNPESPAPGGDKDSRPANVLSFPSATCSKCKRCILVTRLNNHMGSCIGNSGRNASRAAAQKISGSGNGDGTPPSSQKGTPMPGSRASSPKKRDVDDLEEDEDSETSHSHKKKKIKTAPPTGATATASPLTKKVILKTKGPKKEKVKGSSSLSQEHKISDQPGPEGNSNTSNPNSSGKSGETAPKKLTPKSGTGSGSPAKKLKLGSKPSLLSSPLNAAKQQVRDADAESESSGTLSSPPR